MADLSLNHNINNPHIATHSMIFLETNPTKMTLVSHIDNNDIRNGEILANINRNSVLNKDYIYNERLGIGHAISISNKLSGIKHNDYENSIDSNRVHPSNQNTLATRTKINGERTKPSSNPSLPLPNSIQNDDSHVSGKQVTVKHSINIVDPLVKGNKKNQNYDLPSAESTHPFGGSGSNNNNDRLDLDYVIELVSPSSQQLTHMHLIHPTFIPRNNTIRPPTEKTILNPLFDPNFQPINRKGGGKRWSVKKNNNNNLYETKQDQSNDNVLKASFLPDLPFSKNNNKSGSSSTYSNLTANIRLSVILFSLYLSLNNIYNLMFIASSHT